MTDVVADLVSSRQAYASELGRTAQLAVDERHRIRDDRGGRWHLEHDAPSQDLLGAHQHSFARADGLVVVGCVDNVVVGFARAELSESIDGRLCMIEELVVDPPARGIGVGSEMLAEVRRWAVEHDCLALESQVLPGNRAAKNFFERLGMKTRKMRVSTDLS